MHNPTLYQDRDPESSVPIPGFPPKVYVDGKTLIAWLWEIFQLKADRSKLVNLVVSRSFCKSSTVDGSQ